MMDVIKFVKLDITSLKRHFWICIFPIIVFFVDGDYIFSLAYILFGGMIIAPIPFLDENEDEKGFRDMLPSKPGTQVLAHFTFSIFVLFVSALVGNGMVILKMIYQGELVNIENFKDIMNVSMLFFSTSVLIMGFENTLFNLFRYKQSQVLSFLKIIPGFVFFFGIIHLSKSKFFTGKEFITFVMNNVILIISASLLIYIGAAVIAGKCDAKRKFVDA